MARKTTSADVARAAGVSPATVDRVLNSRGGVSPKKERAVLDAARRLKLDRALENRPWRQLRVAVLLQPPENPFHAALAQGFRDAARLHDALNIQFLMHHLPPDVPGRTVRLVRRLAADHDALVLCTHDTPQVARAVEEIERPVVTVATGLTTAAPTPYVGPDNYRAGRVAGEVTARFLGPGGGTVLILIGHAQLSGQKQRADGFADVLTERFAACRIVAIRETREDATRAGHLVRNALATTPDLSAVYNATAGARAVADAIADRPVLFVTHELSGDGADLLAAGRIDAILDQDPALEAMRVLEHLALHFGRLADTGTPRALITPLRLHLRETVG